MAAPMRPLMENVAAGMRRWCEPELHAVRRQLEAEGRDQATLTLQLETSDGVTGVRVVVYRQEQ